METRITLGCRKRIRKPRKKNSIESASSSAISDDKIVIVSSRRRRRTSWTSLKEIAGRSGDYNGESTNLTVPFSL